VCMKARARHSSFFCFIQVWSSSNRISCTKDRWCWERLLGPFGQLFLALPCGTTACGMPQTLNNNNIYNYIYWIGLKTRDV
jgi:hypothetical protein